jgi:hypothetical protein
MAPRSRVRSAARATASRYARVASILALSATSCGAPVAPVEPTAPRGSATAAPAATVPLGAPVSFRFADARRPPASNAFVDARDLQGRITLVVFVTTYDVASQAATRFVQRLAREHVPRLNVVLVVLERMESRPLVEAFADALDLTFPVAMADEATIAGQGPFQGLHHVPSFVVLDREGRERERQLGLIEYAPLEELVRRVEHEAGVKLPREPR